MQQLPSNLETAILVGAVADLISLQQTPEPTGKGYGELQSALEHAQQGLVRCEPFRWTMGPTDDSAFRVAISRSYAALERRGLVERVACGFEGKRLTHLRPTEAGITLAQQLTTQPQEEPIR